MGGPKGPPAEEEPYARSFIVSVLNSRRAIPKGKWEIHKRVKTVGCYPLVPSAGSVHLPCEMVAMQQFLRSVRARLIQILTVQRLNRRIFVRKTQRCILIESEQNLAAVGGLFAVGAVHRADRRRLHSRPGMP